MSVCLHSAAHEKELIDINCHVAELQRQKESALREVAELKVQLKMVEETRDTIRRDLIDANRRIREGTCDKSNNTNLHFILLLCKNGVNKESFSSTFIPRTAKFQKLIPCMKMVNF